MNISVTGMSMPKCCVDCNLLYDYMGCSVTGTRADFEKMDSERLPNCPLKEINDNTKTIEKSEKQREMTTEEAIKALEWKVEYAKEIGESYTDCVYVEALDTIIQALKERPKGKWINHRNDYGHNIADCSLCGKTMQWHDEDEDGIPRYCWYCGAAMKGVAE